MAFTHFQNMKMLSETEALTLPDLFRNCDRRTTSSIQFVLVFWLTVIFATSGLFAPRNATVFAVWFVCALSVSGAVFLILGLDTPLQRLLQISSDPMRDALARIEK